MGAVVLVRHGETAWSRDGRHTGRTDVPLTPLGRSRAVAAGQRLRAWRFDRVLASPRTRAQETCQLAGFGAQMTVAENLAEWDYGEYEGRSTAEIREQRPDWLLWRDGVPGGESLDDVGRRADRIIAELAGVPGPSVVFAHGHILRVLAARWIGMPPLLAQHMALGTASISILGTEHEYAAVLLWNDRGEGAVTPVPHGDVRAQPR